MYPFEYVKASSLGEVSAFLKSNPEARPLAGGMTLFPTLKARLAQPSHLVDINGLQELVGIEVKGDVVTIGGGTRHAQVADSKEVKQAIPALAKLAKGIGDPAVRNRGTLGGSVANNDPAADYPAAVLGLGATVVTDRREIAADDFFMGMFTTALEPDELIVRIRFPLAKRAAYQKFAHPASGYAMTGVFVAETASGIRVAVTGAGPGVYRWQEAEDALSRELSVKSVSGLRMKPDELNEDIHGSREYRANLVNVMTKRAVAQLEGK